MTDLTLTQLVLVLLIFVWSGFVRTGLGFGGAMMALPLSVTKGLPSFMTCQHARASLCATALMATTDSALALFFWYQRS